MAKESPTVAVSNMNLERRLKTLESRVPDDVICFGSIGGIDGEYSAKQLYNAPDGEFEKIISGNSVKDVALILSIFRERAIGLCE